MGWVRRRVVSRPNGELPGKEADVFLVMTNFVEISCVEFMLSVCIFVCLIPHATVPLCQGWTIAGVKGQPALLYLVPLTCIPLILFSAARG